MTATPQVRVMHNDPSVHCIDISNRLGERVIRIRPHPVTCGISLNVRNNSAVVLNFDDLDELLGALSRIQVTQGDALEQLRNGAQSD